MSVQEEDPSVPLLSCISSIRGDDEAEEPPETVSVVSSKLDARRKRSHRWVILVDGG